jgi:hypothetical protein
MSIFQRRATPPSAVRCIAEKVMSDAVAQAADREGKYLTFSLAGEEYGNGILREWKTTQQHL